jgi:hypothetical protein
LSAGCMREVAQDAWAAGATSTLASTGSCAQEAPLNASDPAS